MAGCSRHPNCKRLARPTRPGRAHCAQWLGPLTQIRPVSKMGDANGGLVRTQGYRVLIGIEDFSGVNRVATLD